MAGNSVTRVRASTGRALTRRQYCAATLQGGGAAALLAACAPSDSAPPSKAAGPVTVVYMSNLPDTHPEGAARLAAWDEFNKTNSLQITVDVTDGRAATAKDKLKTLAAGGTPPHLYWTAYSDAAELFASTTTIDVDTELKREPDWSKQRADLFPFILESSMWNGKMVAIAGYTNNAGLIYNTGLLQQAAVAPPKQGWTWDDFTGMAQKFVRPGLIPLSMGWRSGWRQWLSTAGARPVTKDAKKMTVDTPEMLSVMELWLDLRKRGIILLTPEGTTGLSETYQLAKNDTVFELQGSFRIPTMRQRGAPDFATTHVPVHPMKRVVGTTNGGHSMTILKEIAPEKRHAAALAAKWMNSPAGQVKMVIGATSIPVSKATMESKELQDYLKKDPQFKGFVDLAPLGWRIPTLPSSDPIANAIADNVEAIMRNEIGPKAGLTKAQQQTQSLLDEDVKLMK